MRIVLIHFPLDYNRIIAILLFSLINVYIWDLGTGIKKF